MRYLLALILLSVTGAAAASQAAAAEWRTYTNARFGFAVDYPADIFRLGRAPANDDGRVLGSRDGQMTVTVSGSFNAQNLSIAKLYDLALGQYGRQNVSHRRLGKDWYVVSGVRHGSVFYDYGVVVAKGGSQVIGTLTASYPVSRKGRMDAIVARMQRRFGRSFRSMPLGR